MSAESLTLVCPPIRTGCHPDENPISYLVRLAKSNRYPAYRWLLQGKDATTQDFERLFQVLFAVDWTGFQQSERDLAQVCGLPKTHVNSTNLRYCPLCIKEHGYWRMAWQLKLSVACTHHDVWLQDFCPHCQKAHPFSATRGNQSVCLDHLPNAESILAPLSVIELQRFVESGMVQKENHCFEVSNIPTMQQRCDLVVFMIKWLAIGENLAKPKRQIMPTVADMKQPIEAISEALFTDNAGFWRYLQSVHLSGASFIGIQQTRLVYFYRQFFKEFEHRSFQSLRSTVEMYATMNLIRDITQKHTLFSANAKKIQQWYSFKRACKEYDLPESVLSRAILDKRITAHHEKTSENYTKCAIFRPDLEKILPHLKDLISAREVLDILGVTKAQFAQLQNSGCFKFEVSPSAGYCQNWQYSRSEVESLLDNINRGAALITDDCVLLATVMQNLIQGDIEMPYLQVFKAILSGQLIVRKPDNKPRKLRELSLDKGEFYKWLSQLKPNTGAMTISEVANVLNINEEFCYQLVNFGYLSYKSDSKNAKMIFPDHIRQFKQRYVIMAKLALDLKCTSALLMKVLSNENIYPVDYTENKKLRQKLYSRKDLLNSSEFFDCVQYLPEDRL